MVLRSLRADILTITQISAVNICFDTKYKDSSHVFGQKYHFRNELHGQNALNLKMQMAKIAIPVG